MSPRRTRKEEPLKHTRTRPHWIGARALLAAGVLAAAIASLAHAAPAAPAKETKQAMVIEGDNHLFMVAAPAGWVLDDTSGMGSRIRCVFYPKGQQWSSAPTVMYVNPLHGHGIKTRTLQTLIAEDEKAFKKRAPKGRITEGGTLPTGAVNKSARVRYFSESGGPPHDAVAYVAEKDLVMLVVLSSRTPAGFQKSLPAYRELVQSYAWVGSHAEFGR